MLSENNHEGIGDAKRDTAQNANEEAIHGKACTTARISVQAPAVRTERGGSEMSHARLLDRLRRFVDLVNSGDTESFLAFFPDDGVVEDSGRRFVGHDGIRRWSDRELIGAKGQMTVTGFRQNKNGTSITADWKSNYFTGPACFAFEFGGDRIRELRITSA